MFSSSQSSLSTSTSSVGCRFPPELLLDVLSFVNHSSDILTLMLSSSVFVADAEKMLYTGVINKYDLWNKKQHELFLQRILSDPHLAALVRVYSVRDIPTEDAKFVKVLRPALQAMIHLEELTMESAVPTLHYLDECTFSLRKFTLLSKHENPGHVLAILSKHPNLTAFELERGLTFQIHKYIRRLPQNAQCTEAMKMVGGQIKRSVDYLISRSPNKKVERDPYLHLPVDRDDIVHPNAPSLTDILSHKKYACFGKRADLRTSDTQEGVLKSFIHSLEHVKTLELIDRPEDDVDSARYLPSLNTLILTSPVSPLRTRFEIDRLFERFEFLRDLYIHCPSQLDSKRPSEEWVYEKWSRDGAKEVRKRGEWKNVFFVQWDQDSMVTNRYRPWTCFFNLDNKS